MEQADLFPQYLKPKVFSWLVVLQLNGRNCFVVIRVLALLVRDEVYCLVIILLFVIIQGKQVGHCHFPMGLLKNLPLKAHLLSFLNHVVDLELFSQDDQLSVY